MNNTTTLEQLTTFYLNESKLVDELLGIKQPKKKSFKVKKEVLNNIKNFSKVLSIRNSSLIDRYEIILN